MYTGGVLGKIKREAYEEIGASAIWLLLFIVCFAGDVTLVGLVLQKLGLYSLVLAAFIPVAETTFGIWYFHRDEMRGEVVRSMSAAGGFFLVLISLSVAVAAAFNVYTGLIDYWTAALWMLCFVIFFVFAFTLVLPVGTALCGLNAFPLLKRAVILPLLPGTLFSGRLRISGGTITMKAGETMRADLDGKVLSIWCADEYAVISFHIDGYDRCLGTTSVSDVRLRRVNHILTVKAPLLGSWEDSRTGTVRIRVRACDRENAEFIAETVVSLPVVIVKETSSLKTGVIPLSCQTACKEFDAREHLIDNDEIKEVFVEAARYGSIEESEKGQHIYRATHARASDEIRLLAKMNNGDLHCLLLPVKMCRPANIKVDSRTARVFTGQEKELDVKELLDVTVDGSPFREFSVAPADESAKSISILKRDKLMYHAPARELDEEVRLTVSAYDKKVDVLLKIEVRYPVQVLKLTAARGITEIFEITSHLFLNNNEKIRVKGAKYGTVKVINENECSFLSPAGELYEEDEIEVLVTPSGEPPAVVFIPVTVSRPEVAVIAQSIDAYHGQRKRMGIADLFLVYVNKKEFDISGVFLNVACSEKIRLLDRQTLEYTAPRGGSTDTLSFNVEICGIQKRVDSRVTLRAPAQTRTLTCTRGVPVTIDLHALVDTTDPLSIRELPAGRLEHIEGCTYTYYPPARGADDVFSVEVATSDGEGCVRISIVIQTPAIEITPLRVTVEEGESRVFSQGELFEVYVNGERGEDFTFTPRQRNMVKYRGGNNWEIQAPKGKSMVLIPGVISVCGKKRTVRTEIYVSRKKQMGIKPLFVNDYNEEVELEPSSHITLNGGTVEEIEIIEKARGHIIRRNGKCAYLISPRWNDGLADLFYRSIMLKSRQIDTIPLKIGVDLDVSIPVYIKN